MTPQNAVGGSKIAMRQSVATTQACCVMNRASGMDSVEAVVPQRQIQPIGMGNPGHAKSWAHARRVKASAQSWGRIAESLSVVQQQTLNASRKTRIGLCANRNVLPVVQICQTPTATHGLARNWVHGPRAHLRGWRINAPRKVRIAARHVVVPIQEHSVSARVSFGLSASTIARQAKFPDEIGNQHGIARRREFGPQGQVGCPPRQWGSGFLTLAAMWVRIAGNPVVAAAWTCSASKRTRIGECA